MHRLAILAFASSLVGCRSCSSSSSSGETPPPIPSAAIDASPPADVDIKTWPDVTGPGTDIGSAEPTLKAFADPKKRWELVCQGAEDPRATWRFVLGAGKGHAIDGVLAIAPKGDFLVLAVDGRTMLVDVGRGIASRIVDEPTVAAFSKDGTKVVYVDHQEIVRLDLASRASNRVPVPAGPPYLVDVDASGSWATISVGRSGDDNWYGPPDDLSCAQPDAFVLNFVRHGMPVWVDLETGRQIADKQVVRVAGGHVYRVEHDKLTIDDSPAGPKDCDAQRTLSDGLVVGDALVVMGVVESPPRALVFCKRTKGIKTSVELVSPEKTLATSKASMIAIDVNNVAPMIEPKAGRICEEFEMTHPLCIDVTSGAKSQGTPEPEEAFGMHGQEWWYAGADEGFVLAGPEHGGPLHWISRPK